ncbi:hypothetical protein [Williamsia sterculiae]|nr:hypothetical protein [Williamsia sterculiae]
MIEEMQLEATALLAAGEYEHALAEFSVLREIRARREGPYSVMYLSNLHDAVRCMCHLRRWSDSEPLSAELCHKYSFTHAAAESDAVDAAKRYAWALLQLGKPAFAADVYRKTAAALTAAGDDHQADRMLALAQSLAAGHRIAPDGPGEFEPV